MKFNQLVVLLPCHSLEDFTLHRNAKDAGQLLASWSALWHPALLASAQSVPTWLPADTPPRQPAGYLFTLPDCSRRLLPDEWLAEAEAAGACVLGDVSSRQQLVAAALGQIESDGSEVDAHLAADFLALGFCHFLVELLTRQLRYMSNLDETSFKSATLTAAAEALRGDVEAARKQLQSAFDLLHQAREYFYPVQTHLLDLTLVAPSTLGASLRDELASSLPTNLLIPGATVAQMAREEPATLAALAEALTKNRAGILGGEFDERELPLLTPEAILHHLRLGLDTYRRHLGVRPTTFGRRRFGLSPVLPGILKKLGFSGVLHCTLDDGRFPSGNQSRVQWEGLDGSTMEAIGRIPIDIGRADAFLRLPEKLGNAMDLDHVATVILAHWPGQSSPWYEDLRRIAAYTTVVGTFTTIDEYFRQTGMTGQQTLYLPDQYRAPYLKQAVAADQPDPISRWVRYFGRRMTLESSLSLDALATLLVCGSAAGGVAASGSTCADEESQAREAQIRELTCQVEDSLAASIPDGGPVDEQLQRGLSEAVARFARALGGSVEPNGPQRAGCLVANPWSFSRRVCLEVPDLAQPPEVVDGGTVRAAWEKSVVVDVPPMGFAWVGAGSGASRSAESAAAKGRWLKSKSKPEPPMAEGNVLRSDFFEVTLDPHSGGIRSISDYQSRDSRIAQQIALRTPGPDDLEPDDDAHYSIMAADEIVVTSPGPLLGEIVARGRLVDRTAQRVAGFTQTTRVRRGSRVVELILEVEADRLPRRDPWNSYYAARFAWSDATANLYRSVSLANHPTDCVQLEAPYFIDVRSESTRVTLLTGGLPYHRRFGLRKLDTLLLVHGERSRRFRLGIGVELPHPVPAALDFLAPETAHRQIASPPLPSGWLFHLDVRNVIATHWEPWTAEGRLQGVRVRLLETDGRSTRLGLRSFRQVASAQKINPGERPPTDLTVDGDKTTVNLGGHEWVEVEIRFGG